MGSRRTFSPQELGQLAECTLAHYRQHAEDFREGTRDHDVSQNIAVLLQHIVGPPPFTILDLGCGPGWPVARHMAERGLRVTGVDSSPTMISFCRSRLPDHA